MSVPMSYKLPFDFGVPGMAAALSLSEDAFRAARARGDVGPPDTVRDGGPRWSPLSLAAELKKIRPANLTELDALVWAFEALRRAEQSEGSETP